MKQNLVADRYNLNKSLEDHTRKKYQIDVVLEGIEISSVDDTLDKIRDSVKSYEEI
jgi:hypothetical protein